MPAAFDRRSNSAFALRAVLLGSCYPVLARFHSGRSLRGENAMAMLGSDFDGGTSSPTKMRYLFTMSVWVFIGPLGMLVTLMKIVERGTGWTTGQDGLFFAFLAAALVARWVDYANGDPVAGGRHGAKPGAAMRYTVLVGSLGALAWVVANVIGNHLLR
jgi:hypothetical protein